jgi:hypothetical protein
MGPGTLHNLKILTLNCVQKKQQLDAAEERIQNALSEKSGILLLKMTKFPQMQCI